MKFKKLVKSEEYLIDNQVDKENKLELFDELDDQCKAISKDIVKYFDYLPVQVMKSGLSYKQVKQVEELINNFDFEVIPALKKDIEKILSNGDYTKL